MFTLQENGGKIIFKTRWSVSQDLQMTEKQTLGVDSSAICVYSRRICLF